MLMENAGQNAYRALAAWIRSDAAHGTVHSPAGSGDTAPADPERRRVVFVCGGGNNGGDAMVMARACFQEGLHQVTVLLARGGAKGDAERNLTILRKLGVPIRSADPSGGDASGDPVAAVRQLLDDADIIVDGISGTGIRGGLRRPLSDLVREINAHPAPVCAVDVPSGVSDGFAEGLPAVSADLTLTMGTPKQCLYLPGARSRAGAIVPIPVGFPRELLTDPALTTELAELSDLTLLLPPVRRDVYKKTRGVVAVHAGAPGTAGAATLCAEAAARSGAGMTHLYVDPDVYGVVATASDPSIMVRSRSSAVHTGEVDAFVAGPGWGLDQSRRDILGTMAQSGVPSVLDADGLNVYAAMARVGSEGRNTKPHIPPRFVGPCVLTPHPGEFRRLLRAFALDEETAYNEETQAGSADHEGTAADSEEPAQSRGIFEQVAALARAAGCVVCYKSHVVYIAAPDPTEGSGGGIRVVDGMVPELATAGAGDLLAGVIGGLLARGLPAYDATVAGVLIHQEAARRLRDDRGWFIATDLLSEIGRVIGDFTEAVYDTMDDNTMDDDAMDDKTMDRDAEAYGEH
jgi:NAD(P)H-hydrate epimerase